MPKTKPTRRVVARQTKQQTAMDKVKIKRVKKNKKKVTTGEKVLGAVGFASTLLGGGTPVNSKPATTQFVRTNNQEQGSASSKIKDTLNRLFGISKAEAATVDLSGMNRQEIISYMQGLNVPNPTDQQQQDLAKAQQIYYASNLGQNLQSPPSQITSTPGQNSTSVSSEVAKMSRNELLAYMQGLNVPNQTPEQQQNLAAAQQLYYSSNLGQDLGKTPPVQPVVPAGQTPVDMVNPTEKNTYSNTSEDLNPHQFATLEAAKGYAKLLGGTVEAVTYKSGPYQLTQPMYVVRVGNAVLNAGLVAQTLQNYGNGMQMIQEQIYQENQKGSSGTPSDLTIPLSDVPKYYPSITQAQINNTPAAEVSGNTYNSVYGPKVQAPAPTPPAPEIKASPAPKVLPSIQNVISKAATSPLDSLNKDERKVFEEYFANGAHVSDIPTTFTPDSAFAYALGWGYAQGARNIGQTTYYQVTDSAGKTVWNSNPAAGPLAGGVDPNAPSYTNQVLADNVNGIVYTKNISDDQLRAIQPHVVQNIPKLTQSGVQTGTVLAYMLGLGSANDEKGNQYQDGDTIQGTDGRTYVFYTMNGGTWMPKTDATITPPKKTEENPTVSPQYTDSQLANDPNGLMYNSSISASQLNAIRPQIVANLQQLTQNGVNSGTVLAYMLGLGDVYDGNGNRYQDGAVVPGNDGRTYIFSSANGGQWMPQPAGTVKTDPQGPSSTTPVSPTTIDVTGLQVKPDVNNSLTGTIKIGGQPVTLSVLQGDGRIFDSNGQDVTQKLSDQGVDINAIRSTFSLPESFSLNDPLARSIGLRMDKPMTITGDVPVQMVVIAGTVYEWKGGSFEKVAQGNQTVSFLQSGNGGGWYQVAPGNTSTVSGIFINTGLNTIKAIGLSAISTGTMAALMGGNFVTGATASISASLAPATLGLSAVVGGVVAGITAILNKGQDKVRDTKRIESAYPYFNEIIQKYYSVSPKSPEEAKALHDAAHDAIQQIFNQIPFEKESSRQDQQQWLEKNFYSGLDQSLQSWNNAFASDNQNMTVYQQPDGTRVGGTGPWGQVRVSADGQLLSWEITSDGPPPPSVVKAISSQQNPVLLDALPPAPTTGTVDSQNPVTISNPNNLTDPAFQNFDPSKIQVIQKSSEQGSWTEGYVNGQKLAVFNGHVYDDTGHDISDHFSENDLKTLVASFSDPAKIITSGVLPDPGADTAVKPTYTNQQLVNDPNGVIYNTSITDEQLKTIQPQIVKNLQNLTKNGVYTGTVLSYILGLGSAYDKDGNKFADGTTMTGSDGRTYVFSSANNGTWKPQSDFVAPPQDVPPKDLPPKGIEPPVITPGSIAVPIGSSDARVVFTPLGNGKVHVEFTDPITNQLVSGDFTKTGFDAMLQTYNVGGGDATARAKQAVFATLASAGNNWNQITSGSVLPLSAPAGTNPFTSGVWSDQFNNRAVYSGELGGILYYDSGRNLLILDKTDAAGNPTGKYDVLTDNQNFNQARVNEYKNLLTSAPVTNKTVGAGYTTGNGSDPNYSLLSQIGRVGTGNLGANSGNTGQSKMAQGTWYGLTDSGLAASYAGSANVFRATWEKDPQGNPTTITIETTDGAGKSVVRTFYSPQDLVAFLDKTSGAWAGQNTDAAQQKFAGLPADVKALYTAANAARNTIENFPYVATQNRIITAPTTAVIHNPNENIFAGGAPAQGVNPDHLLGAGEAKAALAQFQKMHPDAQLVDFTTPAWQNSGNPFRLAYNGESRRDWSIQYTGPDGRKMVVVLNNYNVNQIINPNGFQNLVQPTPAPVYNPPGSNYSNGQDFGKLFSNSAGADALSGSTSVNAPAQVTQVVAGPVFNQLSATYRTVKPGDYIEIRGTNMQQLSSLHLLINGKTYIVSPVTSPNTVGFRIPDIAGVARADIQIVALNNNEHFTVPLNGSLHFSSPGAVKSPLSFNRTTGKVEAGAAEFADARATDAKNDEDNSDAASDTDAGSSDSSNFEQIAGEIENLQKSVDDVSSSLSNNSSAGQLRAANEQIAAIRAQISNLKSNLHSLGAAGQMAETEPSASGLVSATTHIVKKGDTLWSIAKKYYGDGKLWRKVLQANTNVVKTPKNLPVGAMLNIPARPGV